MNENIMGWEKEYEGYVAMLDAADCEELAASGVGHDEIEAFLSEDGEARRRFLKQALLTGGALAARNMLLSYRLKTSAQTTPPVTSAATETASTIPVTLRVNGR